MSLTNIIPSLVFYLFATVATLCALTVAFGRKPVASVIAPVFVFIASAVLWLLANAEFLSLALIFVYVGAVMTLFLFIVMMLNVESLPIKGHMRAVFYGFIILFSLVGMLLWLTSYVTHDLSAGQAIISGVSNQALSTEAIGQVLYSTFGGQHLN